MEQGPLFFWEATAIINELVNKSLVIYGIVKFSIVLTKAPHSFWSLWNQTNVVHTLITYLRSIRTLSYHLCLHLQNVLFTSYRTTKILRTFMIYTLHDTCLGRHELGISNYQLPSKVPVWSHRIRNTASHITLIIRASSLCMLIVFCFKVRRLFPANTRCYSHT
jgi:hypothetical protein